MRIVSLVPSATELICGLGLGDKLVGVSHECDFPASVAGLPVLTRSRIPENLNSVEIDKVVTEKLDASMALYDLETDRLVELKPDLIVTQALCNVCAVSEEQVGDALCHLPGNPDVINLEPECLEDVLEGILLIASATGCNERARNYMIELQEKITLVSGLSSDIPIEKRPRVALLEWLDPLFDGGHWSPEIIEFAGGDPCFGEYRRPSRRREWNELIKAEPDIIFVALCGFDITRSQKDVDIFTASPHFRQMARNKELRVFLVDGNAYFSRPGPRLVDALQIMANALHPDHHRLPSGIPAALEIEI